MDLLIFPPARRGTSRGVIGSLRIILQPPARRRTRTREPDRSPFALQPPAGGEQSPFKCPKATFPCSRLTADNTQSVFRLAYVFLETAYADNFSALVYLIYKCCKPPRGGQLG